MGEAELGLHPRGGNQRRRRRWGEDWRGLRAFSEGAVVLWRSLRRSEERLDGLVLPRKIGREHCGACFLGVDAAEVVDGVPWPHPVDEDAIGKQVLGKGGEVAVSDGEGGGGGDLVGGPRFGYRFVLRRLESCR